MEDVRLEDLHKDTLIKRYLLQKKRHLETGNNPTRERLRFGVGQKPDLKYNFITCTINMFLFNCTLNML